MKHISLIIILATLSVCARAAIDSVPVANNKTIDIQSKYLGETRSIWVHLPDDYYQSTQTYPVLYVLDGDSHFEEASAAADFLAGYDRDRMPNIIVVAITNVDRLRDFTPIHSAEFNGKGDTTNVSGGGSKFLRYISDEVVPLIDSSFRIQPYRILAAHSLGGLLALYAMEQKPDLFQSFIFISPAFYGANNKVFTQFTPFLQSHPSLKEKLYITIGDENLQKVDSFQTQLTNSAPKTVTWSFMQYKGENHFSVPFKSIYDGLKFIYKNWFIDYYNSAPMDYASLQKHYDSLSAEFGYPITPTEDMVNNLGYVQLRAGHIDNAIDLFKQNTMHFPNSWNAFDSLGEGYMDRGDKENAIVNYKKSLKLNPNSEGGKAALKKLTGK